MLQSEQEPKVKEEQSTLDYKPKDGLLALFKGNSGTGKSVGALSFPNAYVFDFDRKMPAISVKHFPKKDVRYNVFRDMWELSDKIEEFERECPFETLIADSFTSLANLSIETVAFTKGETVPEMLKRVQETKNKNKQLELMPIDYYGGEDRACTWFVNQLKRLQARPGNPKYVIIIAHVITVEYGYNPVTKETPLPSKSIVSKGKKVAAWLPTEFDNVWSFENHNPDDTFAGGGRAKRICYTETYGEDSAKCSLDIPPQIDFTNGSLYSQIYDRVKL